MTIEFSCSSCGKVLRTNDDKAGLQAKCPGCGDVLTVPSTPMDDAPGLEMSSLTEQALAGEEFKACPMCGEQIQAQARKCRHCGEVLPGADVRTKEPLNASRTLSVAWAMTKPNFWRMIGSMIVSYIALAVMSFGIMFAMQMMMIFGGVLLLGAGGRGGGAPAVDPTILMVAFMGGMIFAYLLVFFVSNYVMMGLLNYVLKLARGQSASLSDLFSGSRYALRALVNSLVFALMYIPAFYLCVAPGVYVLTVFFPFLFVLIDQDLPGLGSLWQARELTRGNRWQLFRVFLMMVGLSILCILPAVVGILLTSQAEMGPAPLILGMLVYIVGILILTPLAMMLGAVAYLHLIGQRTPVEMMAAE